LKRSRNKQTNHRRGGTSGKPPQRRQHGSAATDARLLEGVVSANRAGFGFVRVEGMEADVFLPPDQMNGVTHGDRVRIEARGDGRGRFSGRMVSILERSVKSYLGVMESAGHELRVRSADRRLNFLCHVSSADAAGAKSGDWVIATVNEYADGAQLGRAMVKLRLDPDRPVQMAAETAIARFGLPVEFSADVQREAARWGDVVDPAESARRTDLRALPLVTIDGETARDFDDAVFAERLGEDFRLLVAIADVSHYVRSGTALDAEARARGTSVYFPTRVLPMLPAALSDHLCSLAPHVDRLCMVADMQINARGALTETRVYPAVMRSHARLTYTQAHAALFDRHVSARDALGPLVEKLEPLVEVYHALKKARARRAALDFDAPEAQFEITAGEHVHAIRFDSRNEAHKLIEECMVLANVAVAQQLRKAKMPALYRVHAPPEERKLTALRTTLKLLNIEVQLPEEVRTRDLAQIAPRVRDPALRPFVESLVVRSLAQAVYQPEPIGHFGLALRDYAHFTSPIRRYPDLMIHRALRAQLGLASRDSVPDTEQLETQGADLTRLEKRADESDRYVDTFLKCVYLRDRIGQSFDGIITTVTEFGCFVQILEASVDGLLHLTALSDDDYQMSRDGGVWIGKRSGRRFGPGQRLRVSVAAVKPVEGMVDLELDND
jgi:ribonuclease R